MDTRKKVSILFYFYEDLYRIFNEIDSYAYKCNAYINRRRSYNG